MCSEGYWPSTVEDRRRKLPEWSRCREKKEARKPLLRSLKQRDMISGRDEERFKER
jgi:hypothetical protein